MAVHIHYTFPYVCVYTKMKKKAHEAQTEISEILIISEICNEDLCLDKI